MHTLSLTEATELAEAILTKHGFHPRFVRAIADTVVKGQRDHCDSHGLWRLLGIIHTLKSGKVIPDALPRIEDVTPSLVKADAAGGFSQLAFDEGLPLLVQKAKATGIAAMAINHCVHFSALWIEAERIADEGLAAMAFNPTQAYMAPFGGNASLFGTNPFAFAWPRIGKPPMVFDFATSAVARGEIELHRRQNKPLPLGWGVNDQGEACCDAATVLDSGSMLPFGEHKGSALAMMIELLAGALIGDFTSQESSQFDENKKALPRHGELIIAFDPQRFSSSESADNRAETLFAAMTRQGARIPASRRYASRKISEEKGVEISDTLWQDLTALLNH